MARRRDELLDLAATMLHRQGDTDPGARRYLEALRRSVDRMEHLIDDLLDMASINAGRLSLQPMQLDASEMLDEAVDLLEPLANERGITIIRSYDVRGVPLHADRDRLIQVFGNVLGNAIKFCKPGDIVTVRGVRAGDHVRFSIADTGPGIPRAELAHIFEPYWSGRAGKKTGSGLGLFITNAIVEAHGGKIEVESEEGRGAMFHVTLPVSRR